MSLILLMVLILNGCGGGEDKEPTDSITFISDPKIYLKESEIKNFKFPVQATSELSSKLEFQLQREPDTKFFILSGEGLLSFNDYLYSHGEKKLTYNIVIVASVVDRGDIVYNYNTTNLHKKSSRVSKRQSITIIIGEKPISTPVVAVGGAMSPPSNSAVPSSSKVKKQGKLKSMRYLMMDTIKKG